MKEKLGKKEKERQLKANNSKKSDEVLRDLYYKVVDEAFQVNKKRRNIPILYSTVKDMYIMSNNNPEEIHLQALRLEDEETFFGKEIKRQQREIDRLIDEKVKEMKNS
jgi:translation elongation factor P/translation initiation factor 5A